MSKQRHTQFLIFCFALSMLLVFARLIQENEISMIASLLVALVGTFTMFRDMWIEKDTEDE